MVGAGAHGCWLGRYEKPCVEYFASLIRPGMTAFDVGAHAGYYTLLLSRGVGPTGRVFAFEANRNNAANLKRHLELNAITNVEVIEAAVSDRTGTQFFSGGGYVGHLSNKGEAVATVRLDDYPRPDLVKMDIEGAETAALRGATAILGEGKTVWFVAVHAGAPYTECPALLTSNGYAIDWITREELCAQPR
ncbi:MAG TPA: FkbM family methyltransferase [Xanthobacteraceae bacterium]|jgi:FkbM family methyltransferase